MADISARRVRSQLRLTLPPIDEPAPGPLDEAPFLRPKLHARARRVRRGLLARTLAALQVVAVATLMGSVLWAGYSSAVASDRLRVARVEVSGERFLSEGEVIQLLGPAMGESILSLDLEDLKGKLRASPWVADATVGRTLPDTLRVEIRERVPLALAEADRLYLMDGDGTLIDIYGPRTALFDLPIVRGLQGQDADGRRDRAQRAGALLRDLGELGAELSEVHVEGGGDLRLVLRGHGEVVRLGAPPYRRKLQTYLSLRRDLLERCPNAEYFDLRFQDRIYAKDPPEAAAEAAVPGGAKALDSRPRASPPNPAPEPDPEPAPQPLPGRAGAVAAPASPPAPEPSPNHKRAPRTEQPGADEGER